MSRLKKEDCQVLVVTGNIRKKRNKPLEVFQEYNFAYDSDSISYIFKSVEADIVIFTGALDRGFDWKNESKQASKYMAGLTNVMIQCQESNIKKFIYISSTSVFDGNPEGVVTEYTEPIAINNRNKAILMGEEICKNYHKEANFTISIARVSEIYGKYKDEVLEDNICTRLCKDAIKGRKVTIHENKQHNLIYVDDVVDGIYRITKKNSDGNNVYHIVSQGASNYSEEQLVQVLEEITHKKIKIDIKEPSDNYSNHNYEAQNSEKLGFNEKYDVKKGLKNIYGVIEKKSAYVDKRDKEDQSFFGSLFKFNHIRKSKILPLLENLLFFVIVQFFIVLTRNMYFHEVIDVYLLFVIIIALIYGYVQAVFSVIFSIIGKIFISLSWGSEYLAFNDYNVYLWILQIFTIGVLVGYLKDKYKRKFEDLNDEKDYLQGELTNIKDINSSNVEVRSLYEKRLINYKDSFARIYNIVSQLDAIEPERVIFKAVNVIREIMNTNDVAIYTCDRNSPFCRLMAASSKKAKTLKKSLKISSHEDMYMKLKRQEMYLNNTMNPEHPMIAGGTYKDGQLQTIIMIWSMPFENNNLYEVNVFGVLCKLVERTMERAFEYMENINKSYNRKRDGVLNAKTFEKTLQLYAYGEQEKLVEFSLLKVEAYEGMSEDMFYSLLKQQVRDTDYIGVNSNDETYILLTNSNQKEAQYVIDRLRKNQIIVEIGGRNAS
ncbi:NAD-dependent epimerase/dehydratase family protein [Oceanirhabdus sp. W0125-5]|uniref:NAD-dependent epimerase/dehydratase family protein n=1 Tax=Oceanirhabdus sp. W0125-5 TaxID=2999116 RepID=UPI0022F34781|nr:NAD-dependent epimerase/dehydratase family protein [Oceanirhabdus sp. W0125-5]WBW99716.1 NAD-dependent epimerase/dehydratase family protein [Oceanirhabdus sp. W0125-5]